MMNRKLVKTWDVLSVAASALTLTMRGDAGNSESPSAQGNDDAITLEFAQWWEFELPNNSLRGLMGELGKDNPGIKVKLLSGPYTSTREQIVASTAAGTMSDVVGLDGVWIDDFAKRGAIVNLPNVIKKASYDDSKLIGQMKVDDRTYSTPVTNFVYPMFVDQEILDKAGIKEAPETHEKFAKVAKAVINNNIGGWALPLSLEVPNGTRSDVMPWTWASGGPVLKGGKLFLEGNKDVGDVVAYIKKLWDN